MDNVIYYQEYYNKLVMDYNNQSGIIDAEEEEFFMWAIKKLEEWYAVDEDNRKRGLYSKKNKKKEREECNR